MLRNAIAVTKHLALYGAMALYGTLAGGIVCMVLAPPPQARAQEPGQQAVANGQQGGAFAGMQRVGGEVTAVSDATVTVKAEDGATYRIVTTANTRLMKGRGAPLKLTDLKAGDGVMAIGNLDAPNKTLHAAILFATNGAELREQRANLGKTFIAGKVTAIDMDNARMTIERPDNVAQTIGFDESTSFRRGGRGGMGVGTGADQASGVESGESITLADIKVGDIVRGTGSLKGGIFVPSRLVVAVPGQRRGQDGRRDGAEGPPAPATPVPGTK